MPNSIPVGIVRSAAVVLLLGGCMSSRNQVADTEVRHIAHDGDAVQVVRPNTGPGSDLPNDLRRDFFAAAAAGDIRTAKAMLAAQPLLVDARPDNESRTPLIVATWRNRAGMVKFLLEHGADLEAEDYVWGGSAVGWSGWFGRPSVALVLIEAGAEVNHPNRGGCTPLGSATAALESLPDQGEGQATREDRVAVVELFKESGGVMQQDRVRPWPIIEGWEDHPD